MGTTAGPRWVRAKLAPDDLDTLVAFRDQAAAWLAGQGIDRWQEASFFTVIV